MISTNVPSLPLVVVRRVLAAAIVALVAAVAARAAIMLGESAAILALFGIIVLLAVWRPRYGLYAGLVLAFMFEPLGFDPIMYYGWVVQSGISSWTPFGFITFSLVELSILIPTAIVLLRAILTRQPLRTIRTNRLLLPFLALMLVSVAWGVIVRRGNLTIAIWEIRFLFLGGVAALLVPNVLTERGHVTQAVNLLTFSVFGLSLACIWRYHVFFGGSFDTIAQEGAFAHDTPILMNVVIILLLARLIWPASGRQRLLALTIPVILYAEMITQRRAGWISLDIGLILLAIFMFRLKRKGFYLLVLPLGVLYLGYLAAFWNASGPLAQPARAVRSISSPDARDAASNLARQIEMGNIRYNIYANPITGIGFGRRYLDVYGEFNLSFWPFWGYFTHNSVLYIWLKMGAVGFFLYLMIIGASVIHGIHILKRRETGRHAPMIVALVAALLMVLTYAWVDLGMMSVRSTLLLGFAVGALGAWDRLAPAPAERER